MNDATDRSEDERANAAMMKILRNAVAQMAADFYGPDSGVVVIVSHDHPDDPEAGRVRVSTNLGNDVAARLMFELGSEYAHEHGLDLDGPRVYVIEDSETVVASDDELRAQNAMRP